MIILKIRCIDWHKKAPGKAKGHLPAKSSPSRPRGNLSLGEVPNDEVAGRLGVLVDVDDILAYDVGPEQDPGDRVLHHPQLAVRLVTALALATA